LKVLFIGVDVYFVIKINFFLVVVLIVKNTHTVVRKDIQIPCIRQVKCGALKTYQSFVISIKLSKHTQYICMNYYEERGGHIYQHAG
jgi:hypothetical protein